MRRRIFGQKRDEVTGSWRKLHNNELHNLYSSLSMRGLMKSIRMREAKACSMHGREEECIQDFCGKARKKEITRNTWM
jgi:hypothetical protein